MQLGTSDSSKNDLQLELNNAVMSLDMLKSTNARADSLLKTKESIKSMDASTSKMYLLNNIFFDSGFTIGAACL